MYSLTEKQIDFIIADIQQRGINLEDLQTNLLDHICCIIENELEPNGDFHQLYQSTISKFFKHDLKEIEEETILLLTFKNYYKMKKTMFISGAITGFSLISGSIFKLMHWPGANALLILGIITLSLIFLPLVFLLKIKDSKSKREKVIIGIGILIAILLCLATLFTLMHWPSGNGAIWLTAIAISAFILIPIYFFTGIHNPETKTNTIVTSIMLLGATTLIFALFNIRPSRKTLEMKMINYYQSESLLAKFKSKIYTDSIHDNTLKMEINATCQQIKKIILQNNIGVKEIPEDYIRKNILIEESSLGSNFNDEQEGGKLFSQLISAIKKYNSTSKEKIPLGIYASADILKSISFLNNYNTLSSITQIQLFLAISD
jgi:hypothetical protein